MRRCSRKTGPGSGSPLCSRIRSDRVYFGTSATSPSFTLLSARFFYLQPLQPFGVKADGGRTAVRDVGASAFFDANTGEHSVEPKKPLSPLEVIIGSPSRHINLRGNVLSASQQMDSVHKLAELVEGLYLAIPVLLNLPFADPPYVERVDGTVGASPWRWELSEWRMEFRTTNSRGSRSCCWQGMDPIGNPGTTGSTQAHCRPALLPCCVPPRPQRQHPRRICSRSDPEPRQDSGGTFPSRWRWSDARCRENRPSAAGLHGR